MENAVIFFGSGPVAAKSLSLLQESFTIEAVITKPTTKHEMAAALSTDAPVHTVSNKVELDALLDSNTFSSHVGILIDFGIIVSQGVIDYFPKGIVNSHFSLLPELRGADPISFAILEGKETTGVSLMLLVQAMDEGPLLAQSEMDIDPTETTPSLTEKLIDLSDQMLKEALPGWLDGSLTTVDQPSEGSTYTRKLTKADGVIDWTKPASQIEREVRAYLEWPKSRTTLGDIDCVITESTVSNHKGQPGEVVVDGKELHVACGEESLRILQLKPAGKKEMTAEAFLAGYKNRITK